MNRGERARSKERRKSRKASREMERRDLRVSREHGSEAHAACGRKVRYRSRHGAEAYIATHPTRGLASYQCPYCGGWHLTSHPRA